jgi:hypothetical protein
VPGGIKFSVVLSRSNQVGMQRVFDRINQHKAMCQPGARFTDERLCLRAWSKSTPNGGTHHCYECTHIPTPFFTPTHLYLLVQRACARSHTVRKYELVRSSVSRAQRQQPSVSSLEVAHFPTVARDLPRASTCLWLHVRLAGVHMLQHIYILNT